MSEARTCRVGTITSSGHPHVTAMWFVWDGTSLWLNSTVKSQRWADILKNPTVSVLVDDGHEFMELRGVELFGAVEPVGPAPRTADARDASLTAPELLFARKYTGKDEFHVDGRHAWLRLTPQRVVSWDFRKLARAAKPAG